jgi:hypothetical protein
MLKFNKIMVRKFRRTERVHANNSSGWGMLLEDITASVVCRLASRRSWRLYVVVPDRDAY